MNATLETINHQIDNFPSELDQLTQILDRELGVRTFEDYLSRYDENGFLPKIRHYMHKMGIKQKYWKKILIGPIDYIVGNTGVKGGYADTEEEATSFIMLTPKIFKESIKYENPLAYLMHVIYHEALHAGYVENVEGIKIGDEGLVEALTIMKIKKLFGKFEMHSAYLPIVEQLQQYFEDFTDEEIMQQLDTDAGTTLDNILEFIILNPIINEKNIDGLKWFKIQEALERKWDFLQKYFNRLLNEFDENNDNPHEKSQVNISKYKLNNLLKKSAAKIFEENLLQNILIKIFLGFNLNEVTPQVLEQRLKEYGYFYLIDYIQTTTGNYFSYYNYLEKICSDLKSLVIEH